MSKDESKKKGLNYYRQTKSYGYKPPKSHDTKHTNEKHDLQY